MATDTMLSLATLLLAAAGLYLIVLGLVMRTPEGFSFRRHTGGFGGGSTGWQVSEQLVRVLCGLVLTLLATAIAMQAVTPGPARTDAKASAATGVAAGASAK